MKCVFGRGKSDSNKKWDCYLHINNFGFYENSTVIVNRPNGREDYQIIIMTDGEASFSVAGNITVVKKGTGILYRPGEEQIYSGNGCSFFWIHFSGYEAHALLERTQITESLFKVTNTDAVHGIYRKMLDCTALTTGTTEDMLCAYFITLLGKLSQAFAQPDEGITKVINHMKAEGFKGLSVTEYAEMTNLSEYHFIRKFKKLTGLSPAVYKAKVIIEKATELMENTDMNVTEIASTLGFEDALYFSRFFKKHTGLSPKKYMEMY